MKRAGLAAGAVLLLGAVVFAVTMAIVNHQGLERTRSQQAGVTVVLRDHLAQLDNQVAAAQSSANDAASKADHGQMCEGAHDLHQQIIGLQAGDPTNYAYYQTFIELLTAICGDDPGV